MKPSRFDEMARAMQGHIDERKAQAARVADQGGALMEAAAIGAGDAYSELSLPQRPIDAIMAGAPQDSSGEQLVRAMRAQNVTGPGFGASPTLAMSPQELGIGPSPEWMAASDEQMAEIDAQRSQRVFRAAIEKAAYKQRMQEHSDEFDSPESQAERKRLWREFHAAKSSS